MWSSRLIRRNIRALVVLVTLTLISLAGFSGTGGGRLPPPIPRLV